MENMLVYCMMAMAFIMMPGADFTLTMKITLIKGRKAGQVTACGIVVGLLVHTMAAVLGLSAVIAKSAVLFDVIKYIGAGYLLYLGIASFREKNVHESVDIPEEEAAILTSGELGKLFSQGVLANVLNPKTILFYLTFLPQFVLQSEPVLPQLIKLGLILVILTLAWFLFLVYAMNRIRSIFNNPTFRSRLQNVTGCLLISFGVKIALDKS